MRIIKTGVCIIIGIFLAQGAATQDIVSVLPGGDIVDGSVIEPYTNKWKVSVVDSSGNKQLVRIWTDYAQIVQLDGTDCLHRVQDLYSADYKHQETWINVVRKDDLKPLRFASYTANGSRQYITFGNSEIVYSSNRMNRDFDSEEFDIETPVFDWNLYGILLAALPFESNTNYMIPFWSAASQTADSLTAMMRGKEIISTLNGGQYATQKIITDKGLTFWLTKHSPYVIRLELAMQNRPRMVWEMF